MQQKVSEIEFIYILKRLEKTEDSVSSFRTFRLDKDLGHGGPGQAIGFLVVPSFCIPPFVPLKSLGISKYPPESRSHCWQWNNFSWHKWCNIIQITGFWHWFKRRNRLTRELMICFFLNCASTKCLQERYRAVTRSSGGSRKGMPCRSRGRFLDQSYDSFHYLSPFRIWGTIAEQ